MLNYGGVGVVFGDYCPVGVLPLQQKQIFRSAGHPNTSIVDNSWAPARVCNHSVWSQNPAMGQRGVWKFVWYLRGWRSRSVLEVVIAVFQVLVLVMSDIDMVQDVFVKQYENFHARKEFPLAKNPDTDKYASMFTARGLRWKRIRTLSNPVFKQSNLKRVSTIVNTFHLFLVVSYSWSSDSRFYANIEWAGWWREPNQHHDKLPILYMWRHRPVFSSYAILTCCFRVAFGETKNTQRIGTNPYYDFVKQLFPDKPKFTSNILHLLPSKMPNNCGSN